MKLGTKSVLWGAHQFVIHPLFVAWGWTRCYGFPFDPRLWVAFFVHDLGYWGKETIDGDGETHPELGARVMHFLFDRKETYTITYGDKSFDLPARYTYWRDFCLYHSRSYAKKDGEPVSQLCRADKMAWSLEPSWLYVPRVIATGEVLEYLETTRKKTPHLLEDGDDPWSWHRKFRDHGSYVSVTEHNDDEVDHAS